MHTTLADRVKEARHAAGMSQSEAATAAGVSLSALRNIEQGITTDPRVSTLESILSALAEATSLHSAASTTNGTRRVGRRRQKHPSPLPLREEIGERAQMRGTYTMRFTPGETVEILYFTDDLSSWERTWQPATYVSPYGQHGVDAHIVSCPIGDKAVAFDEIRKVAR